MFYITFIDGKYQGDNMQTCINIHSPAMKVIVDARQFLHNLR